MRDSNMVSLAPQTRVLPLDNDDDKCKQLNRLKNDFNGDTDNITQLKQQKSKGAKTFAAHRHNFNVLLSNSNF